MSSSTGKTGQSQPNIAELVARPSLRRVKEKRPISPSDVGSPFSGTINVEPPVRTPELQYYAADTALQSQSSSANPLPMGPGPPQPTDRFLSPNHLTQQLPQTTQNALPSGFMPQSVTIPAQITVPVTYKGRNISSPIFPTSGGADDAQRPPSGLSNYRNSAHGGSNTSISRPRTRSTSREPPPRPLSALSNSNLSRKSGKEYYVAGPTLTAEPALKHQASNTSLRSTGSYARFDATSYVDPAYFAADTTALPVLAPRSRRGSASSHSGLSYMGPPIP
jgi:hypothetical protein